MGQVASNRVWLITGATSGFGRALAEAAVAAGDIVVGAARRPDRLDDLVAAHPGQLSAMQLDVTDARQCAEVVEQVAVRFGRIDVLVNNAGRTQVGALEETTERELRDLFELHFFGPARLTRAVLPHMPGQAAARWCRCPAWAGRSPRRASVPTAPASSRWKV